MRSERRNIWLGAAVEGLRAAALLCSAGTLLQTFLNVLGFSENQIYIHSTLLQATNVVSILLGARWADSGNLIRRAAWIQLPFAVLFLCYLPLCVWRQASPVAYLLLMGVGGVQSALAGFYTVCSYKLPYCAFTEKSFGLYLSITGVFTSAVTFAVGLLVTTLTNYISYTTLMAWGFGISALLLLITAFLQRLMRPVTALPVPTSARQTKLPLRKILLAPVFRNMIPANLCRGFAMGAITVMPVMALSMGYGQAVATAMVPVQAAAMVVGCILFGLLSGRLRPRTLILLSSLGIGVAVFMLIRGETLFLALYAIVNFSKVILDNSVPAALRRVVSGEIAGPYNAWRMIIHNLGTILGTLAATWIPISGVIVLLVLGQLISGWCYYRARVMRQ